MLRTSPGSHSALTSKGRQQTSQSVVKRWEATLVSIASSELWPQNGHWMVSLICMIAGALNPGSARQGNANSRHEFRVAITRHPGYT